MDKQASLSPLLGEKFARRCTREDRVTDYLCAQKILWKTPGVRNSSCLLRNRSGQAQVRRDNCCTLRADASILLDFGVELQGGISIVAHHPDHTPDSLRVRVRFGESAAEAMSDAGGLGGATNDHAIRDSVIDVATMGATQFGGTGFRFVRIDAMDECGILLESVQAAFTHRDIAPQGSFACSDPLLERIWRTGAYTVFLNMQGMLWDGIKRDRLVWVGDLHTEVSTIQAVYGYDDVVPRSLDFVRDNTYLPRWMNDIASYSMWWVLLHDSWFQHNGDRRYLVQQKDYLRELLAQLCDCGRSGESNIEGQPFLDWPSSPNRQGVVAGVHALHGLCLRRGAALLRALDEPALAARCDTVAAALAAHAPSPNESKQAAALQVLAGQADAHAMNRDILSPNSPQGLSTFLGYYVLQARALAGDIPGCLQTLREYWGGMLALGATTFWEHFDVAWLQNAAPIDALPRMHGPAIRMQGRAAHGVCDQPPEGHDQPRPGQVDVHGAYGDYCYKGYRHSLCHGWASGPTAWLSEHVLGVRPLQPGCTQVRIAPELGDLAWAEGAYPTPHGPIRVRHERKSDGSIQSEVEGPKGVEIVR